VGSQDEVTETPRCSACGPHKARSSESRSHPMYLDYACTLILHFARSDLREGGGLRNSTPHPSDLKALQKHVVCILDVIMFFKVNLTS
jgi:hypothetical protein